MKLKELEDVEFEIGKLIIKPGDALAIKIKSKPGMDRSQVLEFANKYLRKTLPNIKKLVYFDDVVELTIIETEK